MNETEIAWAAGFYDGEGCTGVLNRTDRPNSQNLILQVGQSGEYAVDLLRRFQAAVGGTGSIVGPIHRPNRQPIYRWVARHGDHIAVIIQMLWPYLGPAKRAQAEKALGARKDFYAGRRAA